MKGLFITFEGIEGCGKTTQIELFAKYLRSAGHDVLITREPGGTEIGDQIRQILLNPKNTSISARAELLLYAAARAQHVEGKILPAINDGQTVVSDRYADATTAYQGAARNLPPSDIKELHQIATDNLTPSITFILDLPAKLGLQRARNRNLELGREDRFENEELEFHEKVREGYIAIARSHPERVIVIDAAGTVEETYNHIIEEFEKRDVEQHNRT